MRLPLLSTDILIHAILFGVTLLYLAADSFLQSGATPPLIYPFFLILATITIYRQHEQSHEYQSNIILIPSVIGIFIIGFCLINEMHRDYWAFSSPRQYPVVFRVLWYHAFFLLVHPGVYPKVWNSVAKGYFFLRERGYFHYKVWVLVLIACGVLWFLRSQNISPDGYDWLKHSVLEKTWAGYLREPLGMLIFRICVVTGQKLFALAPYNTLTLVTFLCGFLATWLLRPVIKASLPQAFWGTTLAFVISCTGYTQIFVGNIEIYCLLHLGLAIYLYSAIRYCQSRHPAWLTGLLFGIFFCVHLSAGWWIPTLLILPFIKLWQYPCVKNLTWDISQMLISATIFVFVFWFFLLHYNFDGSLAAMWEHFTSDEVMLVGSDAAMFNPITTYVDMDFYIRMLNEYFFMLPGAIMLLVILVASWRCWPPLQPLQLWFLLFTAFYFVYTIVWHPDRKFPADWDIFSGLTIPAALFLCQLVANPKLSDQAKRYALYQTVVFGSMFVLWTLVRNHQKVTDWPIL